jgi:emfourin
MKPLLAAALASLVVACGSDASSAAELSGTLKYARSGGIAGISERAAVKPDGHVTVSVRKRRTRTARLTGAERERLSRLVREADLAHVKVDGRSECCDQFEYSLSYRGRTLGWSDAHFPKPLTKLVAELDDLVAKYGGGPG